MERENKKYFKVKLMVFSIFAALNSTTLAGADSKELTGLEQTIKESGAAIFNITTTDNGFSKNTVGSFDVTESGLVVNNSDKDTETTLAGIIKGNENLLSGSADVILLEVDAKKPSVLNGPIEIAGSNAKIIISNQSGITCSSCTFIDSNNVVLTTGKFNPDSGYKVERGNLTISGNTKFDETAKNIDLIARSILISGVIDANGSHVKVTTGANQVDINNDKVTEIAVSGIASKYSLQVDTDAEINAHKLTYVGTENKSPLKNSGKISSLEGGIKLSQKASIENTKGKVSSKGNIDINSNDVLSNSTSKIVSSKSITIDTNNKAFSNLAGSNVSSLGSVTINSGVFKNDKSYIASDDLLTINTNGADLNNTSTIGAKLGLASTNGILINSGKLNNKSAQIISAGDIDIDTNLKNFDNINSYVDTYNNINVNSGPLKNTQSRLRSTKKMTINTNGNALSNAGLTADTGSDDSLGILSGSEGMSIYISGLSNDKAIIATEGDMDFDNKGNITNQWGNIKSGGFLKFKTENINNTYGGLASGNGADINVMTKLDNNFGVLFMEGQKATINSPDINNHKGVFKGDNYQINTETLNNTSGLIVTDVSLSINAAKLSNNSSSGYKTEMGFYVGQPDQIGGIISKGNMVINGNSLSTSRGRVITENGTLEINYNTVNNSNGLIATKKNAIITSADFNNNYGVVYSKDNLYFSVDKLKILSSGSVSNNDLEGVISSDGINNFNVKSDFENDGVVSGKKELLLSVNGKYTNGNRGIISGENKLNVEVSGDIVNKGTINSDKVTTISGIDVTNERSGSLIGREGITLKNTGKFINNGRVVGEISK